MVLKRRWAHVGWYATVFRAHAAQQSCLVAIVASPDSGSPRPMTPFAYAEPPVNLHRDMSSGAFPTEMRIDPDTLRRSARAHW